MSSILIKGGRVLSPEDDLDGILDVLVEGSVIRQIATGIESPAGEVIEAEGLVVAPGFVDLHAHLREPGGEISETLETGLAAAVAGGFTSVCAMPNTKPVNDNAAATSSMIEHAAKTGLARVFPIAAVTRGSDGETLTNFEDLVAAGAVGFSDDGRPVKTAELMRQALERAKPLGVPIIDHCEDPALSAGGVINQGPVAEHLGLRGIPDASEDNCVERDLAAAAVTGGRLHIAHLSTAESCTRIREAKRRGVRVSCEVTPHHFTLSDDAVEKYGTHAKMNPPLRSPRDLERVLVAISEGTVDALATDHAPHAPALKARPIADAPFGVIGFETALPLALTQLVYPGKVSLEHLIVMMSSNPAHIIRQNVNPSLGRLQVAGPADITIFDPNCEWTYRAASGRSRSRNSPFDGWRLKGLITTTIVSGKIVYTM